MKVMLLTGCLYSLFLSLAPADPPPGPDSPVTAVTRLMADVSEKPPGAAENDVTSQAAATYEAGKKFRASIDDKRSLRDIIVETYNTCSLKSPLTSLYAQGAGALYFCKARLTPDEIAECKDEASSSATVTDGKKIISTQQGSTPMFGESGLFATYVGSAVPENGEVIATFCLVQQKGQWKVHGLYFSNDVLAGGDKDFVVEQLAAFAKKQ